MQLVSCDCETVFMKVEFFTETLTTSGRHYCKPWTLDKINIKMCIWQYAQATISLHYKKIIFKGSISIWSIKIDNIVL